MDADQLRQYLEFYQDLGIKTVYRRSAAAPAPAPVAEAPAAQPPSPQPIAAPPPPKPVTSSESLLQIMQDIGDCRRCRLHEGRHKIVFGVGNEKSPLVFVGEGPGADEDQQGLPFVGRAGQLLTQMIEGTARKEGINVRREDVYICNVVKCRPPDNRTPEPDEMEICGQFLYRQLVSIAPKAICVLGGTAAKAITGQKEGVTKMRGKWFKWRDIPVMVTYHPSFLLRGYNQEGKREAWEDLKKVLHFVYD
jgi:uracil-DNA glycosylase family 4